MKCIFYQASNKGWIVNLDNKNLPYSSYSKAEKNILRAFHKQHPNCQAFTLEIKEIPLE